MSHFNENEEISVGDVVSKVSGKAANTYLGAAASTAATSMLGTGAVATVAVIAAPFAVAGAVGWAAKSVWDFFAD